MQSYLLFHTSPSRIIQFVVANVLEQNCWYTFCWPFIAKKHPPVYRFVLLTERRYYLVFLIIANDPRACRVNDTHTHALNAHVLYLTKTSSNYHSQHGQNDVLRRVPSRVQLTSLYHLLCNVICKNRFTYFRYSLVQDCSIAYCTTPVTNTYHSKEDLYCFVHAYHTHVSILKSYTILTGDSPSPKRRAWMLCNIS